MAPVQDSAGRLLAASSQAQWATLRRVRLPRDLHSEPTRTHDKRTLTSSLRVARVVVLTLSRIFRVGFPRTLNFQNPVSSEENLKRSADTARAGLQRPRATAGVRTRTRVLAPCQCSTRRLTLLSLTLRVRVTVTVTPLRPSSCQLVPVAGPRPLEAPVRTLNTGIRVSGM
jgi:hypothetical protein